MKTFLYYFSFVLGLALAVVVNVLTGKKRGIAGKQVALYTVLGFIGAVAGAMLMARLYNLSLTALCPGESFPPSNMSLYGGLLFMPLFMLLPLRIRRMEANDFFTLIAPGVFALLGVAKLGCLSYGCCYGISCGWGIYNEFAGETVFPVQLLESLLNFGIAFVCYKLAAHRQCRTVYPIGLVLYGVIRFFIQLLRHSDVTADRGLFGVMDFWQLISVIAVVSGGIWLLCMKATKIRAVPEN